MLNAVNNSDTEKVVLKITFFLDFRARGTEI